MRFCKLYGIFLLVLALAGVCSLSYGNVIYVDSDSPGGQNGQTFDGLSWATAYHTIQSAIDAANPSTTFQDDYTTNLISGDDIWIVAGTYNECVTLKSGVSLYGGFSGYESSIKQRNWNANQTIINGGGNASVITIPSGASEFTTVSGLIITNGNAQQGGGIRSESAKATISNNIITGNNAASGGGIYSSSSSLTIACNVICDNSVSDGGAVYCSNDSSKIINNTITGNTSNNAGAGIYGSSSELDIANNIIAFNTSGVILSTDSSIFEKNCVYGNDQYNYSGVSQGVSNISINPRFVDPENGDYSLSSVSACINRGSDDAVIPNIFDMNGNARVSGEHADMGAFEYRLFSQNSLTPMSSGSISALTLGDPKIIFVKKTAVGPTHDGSSWDYAYQTIQQAINAAVSGDEIWVAADTYYERIALKNGVGLYGGFTGSTETQRNQRDWETNETIIDGQDGNSVVTAGSTITSSTTTIDGFTIQNGTSTSSGGGIYCIQSSPLIKNNKITSNNAAYGAGIYANCNTYAPTIEDNRIESNAASSVGGGIYLTGTSGPTVQRNTITSNSSTNATTGSSGGMYIYGAPASVLYNKITNNSSAYNTGGITLSTNSSTIANNIIANNTTVGQGGGILVYIASPTIKNNTIYGNTGGSNGGGIHCISQSTVTIANNIVVSNGTGGIYKSSDSTITLSHNCVYGNTSYNYSSGVTPDAGSISVAPSFADSTAGDFHLAVDSPCLDAGDDSAVVTGWLDIDGQDRINQTHVDIGADEAYKVSSLTFVPDGGTYDDIQHVVISCPTSGVAIYYTTDGSPPTKNSTLYSGSITISQNCTLKAIGVKNYWLESDVKTAEYIIDMIAPTPGTAISPATASTSPIEVTYTGAYDNEGGSGLNHVELWFKKDTWPTWINSGLQSTTGSGSFTFNLVDGVGTYYFDLVAEDNVGNRSAVPSGNGDCSTEFSKTTGSTGRSSIVINYTYPGGPALSTKLMDENNTQIRQATYNYGSEGELLSVTGDTEPWNGAPRRTHR